jgi:thiamine biosynthesis lipoprotein
VQLATSPVQLDLGGIGKGYAVDRMAKLLREWSIDIALIHGGYSSVLALNGPPGTKGWPVTLSNPRNRKQTLARLCLQNRAVSGSGLLKGQHIIDPRTGQPVQGDQAEGLDRIKPAFGGGKSAAWACAPTAATADALSTAFMVMSPTEVKQYCLRHPKVLAMVILKDGTKRTQKEEILHFGPWKKGELLL